MSFALRALMSVALRALLSFALLVSIDLLSFLLFSLVILSWLRLLGVLNLCVGRSQLFRLAITFISSFISTLTIPTVGFCLSCLVFIVHVFIVHDLIGSPRLFWMGNIRTTWRCSTRGSIVRAKTLWVLLLERAALGGLLFLVPGEDAYPPYDLGPRRLLNHGVHLDGTFSMVVDHEVVLGASNELEASDLGSSADLVDAVPRSD